MSYDGLPVVIGIRTHNQVLVKKKIGLISLSVKYKAEIYILDFIDVSNVNFFSIIGQGVYKYALLICLWFCHLWISGHINVILNPGTAHY